MYSPLWNRSRIALRSFGLRLVGHRGDEVAAGDRVDGRVVGGEDQRAVGRVLLEQLFEQLELPARGLHDALLFAIGPDRLAPLGRPARLEEEAAEAVRTNEVMKGRGFTGVVKRHDFATLHESHGNHYFWRHGGSIGCRKPQHTVRGTRMAGHHGRHRASRCRTCKVLRVDAEKNLLYVRGRRPRPRRRPPAGPPGEEEAAEGRARREVVRASTGRPNGAPIDALREPAEGQRSPPP